MPEAFVWFHNSNDKPKESIDFYQKLLGWEATSGPPGLTLLGGEKGPFAAVGGPDRDVPGWLPYLQVDDVDAATQKAVGLGASLVREKRQGPAGEFAIVRDPGGAVVALWQRG
jgi:predicted enzyme related to lactoylglutathione lyase